MNKKIFKLVLLLLVSTYGSTQDCFDKRLEAAIKSYNEKKYEDAIAQLRLIKNTCDSFDENKINEWIHKATKKKKEQEDADGDGFPNNKDECPDSFSKINGGCPEPGRAFTGFTKKKYEGGTYKGWYVSGQFHGKGTFTYNNGDKYVGDFKENLYDGDGTMFYEDGTKYTGQWQHDKKEGYGVMTWPNEDKYEGYYKAGQKNGQGTYYFHDGRKYTGEWKDGAQEGYGTFIWPDGDRYEGNFNENMINGQGTYFYTNGDRYVGTWKDGKREGYGVMTWTDGYRYEGIFKNDNLTKRNDLGTGFTSFKDYLKEVENCALLEYEGNMSGKDILEYWSKNKKLNFYPLSVFKYHNKYYSVWTTLDNADDWYITWDQSAFPGDSIRSFFKKGFNISFIDKIEGLWYVNMIKYKSYFGQMIKTFPKTIFKDSVSIYSDQGYSIQNMINLGSDYTFLLSKHNKDTIYAFNSFSDSKDFEPWLVDKKVSPGVNYLYCWKFMDGKFFYFMDYFADVETWTGIPFVEKNIETIVKNIKDGFFIDNVVIDDYIRFALRKKK